MPAADPPSLTVLGIGADGWDGLPPPARDLVERARVVVGAPRQLGLLPDLPGQVRHPWPRPLSLDLLDDQLGAGHPVLVLASGDPLVSGIGSTLVARYGAARVEVVPAVSSVALARAAMRWSAESCAVLTVVGRRLEVVVRELSPGRRLLVLSSDEHTPALLAALLVGAGCGDSPVTVLGDLGTTRATRTEATAATWSGPAPRLHVVAIQVVGADHATWAPGLPDAAYEHDGQLTKRDLRASALARLRPQPDGWLWDVGAGAGSVGIEWMRAHPTCRTIAVEQHPERAARIARNAGRLGVPGLQVVTAAAPDALADLPIPDAVFVGGGATVPGVLDTCQERLRPGGRLVVHGVTLETEGLLARRHAELGGELTRHAVETAAPIGSFTGWTPARAVTQWAWDKPATDPTPTGTDLSGDAT